MSSKYLCKGDFFRCQRKPFRILLKPTSIDCELVVRAKVDEIKERKVVVSSTLWAKGEICAKGRVVAVLAPKQMSEH